MSSPTIKAAVALLIRAFSGRAFIAGLLLLILALPAFAFQAPASGDLTTLQRDLAKLQTMFGKDHPKVIAMQKKLGLTKRINELVQDAPNRKAMINQLYPLLVEEQDLKAKFGKDHPKLKIVRAKIELLREYLAKQKSATPAKPSANPSTNSKPRARKPATAKAQPVNDLVPLIVKEQELVARLGEKHPQVVKLRKQIEQIRSTIPRSKKQQASPGVGKGNVSRPIDNTPNVDTDAGKPPRYSMEKKDGNIVLLDRETGKSWLLKTENGSTKWLPIPRASAKG